jgi:hypothetical protein
MKTRGGADLPAIRARGALSQHSCGVTTCLCGYRGVTMEKRVAPLLPRPTLWAVGQSRLPRPWPCRIGGNMAKRRVRAGELGLPPEVAPDDERGTEPIAVRDVGDADEMSAHGPEGDGDLDSESADGQGLPTNGDKGTEVDEI